MSTRADRIARARDVAAQDAVDATTAAPSRSVPRARSFRARVAFGDPQAPFQRVLEVLDHNGLLGDDGRVRADVAVVSMGDHFDWGDKSQRADAARDGRLLLAWLAAHDDEQVVILAGNHDLARVGELVGFDDAGFAAAQRQADRLYAQHDEDAHRAFVAAHPALPSAEVAARDLSTFEAVQRDLVLALLRRRRMVMAHAPRADLLLTHAGATLDDLAQVGVDALQATDAVRAARALDDALRAAVDRFDGGPLIVPGLHHPGTSAGEGRGMLYHRPSDPSADDEPARFDPPRRRFDPQRLPRGLVQAVGHIRDKKCRSLLARFCIDEGVREGPLRSLVVHDEHIAYRRGAPAAIDPRAATMLFLDNAMKDVTPEAYEVLDLDTLLPFCDP